MFPSLLVIVQTLVQELVLVAAENGLYWALTECIYNAIYLEQLSYWNWERKENQNHAVDKVYHFAGNIMDKLLQHSCVR